MRGLTDEEAGQLLSTMAPSQTPAPVTENPPSEPIFGSLSVLESLGSPKRSVESEQQHVESFPLEPSPPPLLSDVVEDVPRAAADSGASEDGWKRSAKSGGPPESGPSAEAGASEEVVAEPNAPSGEFNPLEAMLSVLKTSDSRARRRAAKAAASAAAGAPSVVASARKLVAREPSASEPPARSLPPREPVSREPPSQHPPASGERLAQSRAPPAENRRMEAKANGDREIGQREPSGEKGQLESKPRSPSRLPRFGEVGAASIEQTGSVAVAGSTKRKVRFGAMLHQRPQGELQI